MHDGPAPHRWSLEVDIECTSGPHERFGVLHRITIRPDWSVETEHDLDAERVARSFGGWCSCLFFTEVTVPAYRRALRAMSQGNHYERTTCDLPAPAARAGEDQLAAVLQKAGSAWSETGDPRLVTEGRQGYQRLWQARIAPARVVAIVRAFPSSVLPLSWQVIDNVQSGAVDLDWLSDVVSAFPDHDFADWAGRLREGWRRIESGSVLRLHRLGLRPHDAIGVLEADVSIDHLQRIIELPGVDPSSASRWLCTWTRLRVSPTVIHYQALAARRLIDSRPTLREIDSLCGSLHSAGPGTPSRTDLAMMLALTGDPVQVVRAVRLGDHVFSELAAPKPISPVTTNPRGQS